MNNRLSPADLSERRLLGLASLFLGLFCLALSLAPAARLHRWEVELPWRHWLGLAVWLGAFWGLHLRLRRLGLERDPYLLPVAGLLSGWGLLTIWRLLPDFGLRQAGWLAAGAALMIAAAPAGGLLPLLRRYKYVWLTLGLLLTAVTLLWGVNPGGPGLPRLWLGCCGVYLQPSEPLKLLLLVYLAAYLADRVSAGPAGSPPAAALIPLLAPTAFMAGLALLLLAAQRDLGTALIFLTLYAGMAALATGRKRLLAAIAGVAALAGVAGYFLFDVVRLRFEAWLNPWADPSGRSFQIVQALLSVANGGLLGRGPGLGNPGLVPVAHSDFVYTAIVEETGLIGAVGLLCLVAILVQRGFKIALRSRDPFRQNLAAGLGIYLGAQSILILGGNLRLLPLTGVTLPFISYGGSSLIVSFAALLALLQLSAPPASGEGAPAAVTTPPRLLAPVSLALFGGLAAAALLTGWWAVYRADALNARRDNPRRAIGERYVRRGSLLDRHDWPLVESTGLPGDLSRRVVVPALSPLVGYNSPLYGQAGLEAGMDATLRGQAPANPETLVWINQLLYGQPPPGLDVRLTLDLNVQNAADQALDGFTGGLALLNAASGEILALASHPGYDANRLEADWERLAADLSGPLVNRAVQGRYPIGMMLPALGISSGAETAQRLGFNEAPELALPLGLAAPEAANEAAANSGEPTRASPLQAALAAAALSNDGLRPVPYLVIAAFSPADQTWRLLPAPAEASASLPPGEARQAASNLAAAGLPFWQVVFAASLPEGGQVAWFLAGTLPNWQGAPLGLALALEGGSPAQALAAGQAVMRAALEP